MTLFLCPFTFAMYRSIMKNIYRLEEDIVIKKLFYSHEIDLMSLQQILSGKLQAKLYITKSS